jgi:hypothetical protein
MANEKLDRQSAVGDKIEVNMHAGKIVDATIKAISDSTQARSIRLISVWTRPP